MSPTTAMVPESEASLQVALVKLGFLDELDGDHPRTDGCTMTHFSSAGSQFSEGSDPHDSSEKSLFFFQHNTTFPDLSFQIHDSLFLSQILTP